jgi:F420 biosynthesis protein FbiB-like protein
MNSDLWQEVWSSVEELVSSHELVIDRPRGSQHPRFPELIVPFDYGYLNGTSAGDGGGIDVWIGTRDDRSPNALLVTFDLKKNDSEVKILVGCTFEETQEILRFMNRDKFRAALIHRDLNDSTLIKTRQSIRRFTQDPVPEKTIRRILEAAVQAPSAHNRQPWRFAVLTSSESKSRLARAMGADFKRDLLASGLSQDEAEAQVERSCRRILEAPVAVLLCLDMTEMDQYPDPDRQRAEYLMAVQSVAMAGENLLLAAHAEGLGGVWVCAPLFAQETARASLDLPGPWEPQGLLLVGRSARVPEPRPRKSLEEVARFL